MNEQLSTLIEQGFDKALNYVQSTESFVVEQAPLLIQEVLNYGLAYNSFLCALWFVIGTALAYLSYRLFKFSNVCEVGNDEGPAIAGFFSGAIGTGAIVGGIIELLVVVKIMFAPRLYLLEELRRLM